MTFWNLRKGIKTNIFSYLDVLKTFPAESQHSIRMQLSRLVKKGLIANIMRGWYCFDTTIVDQLELSGVLYQPSYISLESALNYYSMIPDIPQAVTAISPTTTKKIKTGFGNYYYAKLKISLFFGYAKVETAGGRFINIAKKEKAILDYFYVRKVKSAGFLRLDLTDIDMDVYRLYAKSFPEWVQKII